MSKIILIGNQKGGIGKSSIITLLANTLSQAPFNFRVTVVDTDNQKSLVKLRLLDSDNLTEKLPYDILNWNISTLESEIKKLDNNNDFIFVDTGGKLSASDNLDQERILNYIDFLFIPFVAGNFALDASLDYLKFVLNFNNTIRKKRPFQTIGLINRYRDRSRNNQFLLSEITQLQKVVDIKFMRNRLNDYVLFSEVDTLETFYQSDTSDPAKINLINFVNEFIKIVE
jgi:cellulose biosynthesis protein BcsQ